MRNETLKKLKSEAFDIVVIGGGATGTGVALDAATRGLKVALIERGDFASGTSSKSTKLVHGGVRYLERAIKQFDRSQFRLVRDALHERSTLLRIAPHLVHPIPLFTPVYRSRDLPYYLSGLKLYDRLAGKANLKPSYSLSASRAEKLFGYLRSSGLKGGVVYFDGQFDDARMAVSIALTAEEQGAAVANYVEVSDFLYHNSKISGVRVKDTLSDELWDIECKAVINATGPFVDQLRQKDNPKAPKMLEASSGVHIVVDKKFLSAEAGLLIPKTDDGRVLFALPWLNHTLIGTTDNPAKVERDPCASQDDVDYILGQINKYLKTPLTQSDILAKWSGLRPLVVDTQTDETAKISRDHVIQTEASGLISIAGGKWTTYRKMAEETVDAAIAFADLHTFQSQTEFICLVGGREFRPTIAGEIESKYKLTPQVAEHLTQSYGDRAFAVAGIASEGYGTLLHPNHPMIEAEIIYGARVELACTINDSLCRRTRLAFLDSAAAIGTINRCADLLATELKWDESRKQAEIKSSQDFLSKSF